MQIESQFMTYTFLRFQKKHLNDYCEPYLTKLGTDSALGQYTKFVLHDMNYNFYIGPTAMQAI
jgi:hypothetical protein